MWRIIVAVLISLLLASIAGLAETAQQPARLETGVNSIPSLAFTPDGKTLALGGRSFPVQLSYVAVLQLWDVKTRRLILNRADNRDGYGTVAFAAEGKTLVAGLGPGLMLWDWLGLRHERFISPHDDELRLRVSPDGRIVATAGSVGYVELWDVKTGKLKRRLQRPKKQSPASVYWLAFSPKQTFLAAATDDAKIYIWQINSGKLLKVVTGERLLGFSPDGRKITVAHSALPGTLTLTWRDVKTNTIGRTLTLNTTDSFLLPSPDGQALATAFSKASIYFMYPTNGTFNAAFSEGSIEIWNLLSGKLEQTLPRHKPSNIGIFSMTFSPDGRTLAVANSNREIELWRIR